MIQPQIFGKFILLERVSIGGMAEVYRAKLLDKPEFERFFAIKRILPHLAADKEFVTMFINEAKVAVELEHPNVCQIYELGRLGQSHYIAMEYIAGQDVQAIQNHYRQQKKIMSVGQACFIIAQAAQGLDYAHRAVDSNGQPLGLIHRDVSPQNLLVTYDGVVKLIDFGVSKASRKASHSKSGVIKGKFSYLSPEQARETDIDHRSDIFALGVIFWELLTGRRLFQAENELALIEMIGNCQIDPPSKYNHTIPDVVEKICMKALEKDVNKRYSWASEMVIDLLNYINTTKTPFTQWHLQNWMCDTFRKSFESEWTKIPIFNKLNTSADIENYLKTHADEIAKCNSADSEIEIAGDNNTGSASAGTPPQIPGNKSGSLPGVKAVSLSNDKSNNTSGAHVSISDNESDDVELTPESGPTIDDPNLLRFKREERNFKIRKCLVAGIILFCICLIISPVLVLMDIIKFPKREPKLPTTAELNFIIVPEDAENVNFALYKCPDDKCNVDENTPPVRTGNTVKNSLKNLEAGSYQIDLKVSQYKDESYMFTLENGTTETRFEMQHPIPQVAELTINIEQEDFRVYYTGTLVKETPDQDNHDDVLFEDVTDYIIPDIEGVRKIKGIVGKDYTLKAFKPGYETTEESGTISENTEINIELPPSAPFNIEVKTPTRTHLPIVLSSNGKIIRRGETPYTFENVDTSAPVSIAVRRGSTVVWERDIDFTQIDTKELRFFADI